MSTTRRRFLQTAAGAGLVSSLPAPTVAVRQAAAGTTGGEQRDRDAGGAVLVFAGDLFLTHAIAAATEPAARQVLDVLHGADAVIANLENGLSTVGSAELGAFRHGPALRGDPALVSELTALKIRAVSLANNHTGNFGREALLQTRAVLDRACIAHAGAGRNIDEAFAPVVFTAGRRTIALCSVYSYYYNFQGEDIAGRAVAGVAGCRAYDVMLEVPTGFDTSARDKSPYRIELQPGGAHVVMAPLKEDLERLTASVREARRRADFVVVSAHLHWGRHGKSDVPVQKKSFAHAAIDAGADLFVGHGPHTLRGIESYRGKPIAHSLANFVLQRSERSQAPEGRLPAGRESVLLRMTVWNDKPDQLELIPIVIPADGRPRLAAGESARLIAEKVSALSSALGTDLVMESGHARLSF
jgi:poly-gamma-glutamate capsule biosynthesis protein CapA/YwtB (metallophosphatase superfamily)